MVKNRVLVQSAWLHLPEFRYAATELLALAGFEAVFESGDSLPILVHGDSEGGISISDSGLFGVAGWKEWNENETLLAQTKELPPGASPKPDLFALVFFLLSRMEELAECGAQLDQYGRYNPPLERLGRPAVLDYWAQLLKEELVAANLHLVPKPREPFPSFTLDLDHATFFAGKTLPQKLIKLAQNVGEWGRLWQANQDWRQDPYSLALFNTVKACKEANQELILFLPLARRSEKDRNLPWDSSILKAVLEKLKAEPHVHFGLHYGFESYGKPELLKEEVKHFQELLGYKPTLGRAHYLRTNFQDRLLELEDLGIQTDFSLGYFRSSGFLAGTAQPFQAWNFKERRALNTQIQPFGFMDSSAFYQGQTVAQAMDNLELVLAGPIKPSIILHNDVQSGFGPFKAWANFLPALMLRWRG